ncbi:MAG: two-component sensor histidine kinase [Paracoccus denitrificans]|nr:MAG: two-component sensor histidine kinase [Paracoccus denitrificans]PZO84738.1 MAG: two-component sensor histidine kinase [Paracoccus denitrificans]
MDFGWLKRMMPRGLYGRAALILFLPVVAISVVVTVVFVQRHFEDVTRQMTASITPELALLSDKVAGAPNDAAALAAARELAVPLGITVSLPPPTDITQSRLPWDLSGRVVTAEMQERLPSITAVDLSNIRQVRLLVSGARPFAIEFPRRRVSAANPHQLLVLLILTSALMSGISAVFLRNQLRPIRQLAQAAEAYGRGRVEPYKPAGAAEVRSAGAAFLSMRNRIERQNDQRKLMLSGISHDLRTPLTRLKLGLSMMDPDMPPDRADIADMDRDLVEMGRMIDAFLDYVRDDVSDEPAVTMPLSEFAEVIVTDALRAGQDVTWHSGGAPETVATFRPTQLRRAIDNLLGNAARYGRRAEIGLTPGARSIGIWVEDDGPGIPPERREEAIRPFTRLDPARNRNAGGGAGLGLAIVSDIARGHGGVLRLGTGHNLGGLRAEIVLPR